MEPALLCPPSKKAEQQELALKVFIDDDDGDDSDGGDEGDGGDDGDDGDGGYDDGDGDD